MFLCPFTFFYCSLLQIAEQLARQDEKALCLHQILARRLGVLVAQSRVVKISVACLVLAVVDVASEILGNVAVEHHAEDVLLEVPAVYRPAQVVRDAPYRLVKLLALLLFSDICHVNAPVFLYT